MPQYRSLNNRFFEKWTKENAYVFGLLIADGTITENPRGSRYIEFTSTDRELVRNIKHFLGSDHKLSLKRKRQGIGYCLVRGMA